MTLAPLLAAALCASTPQPRWVLGIRASDSEARRAAVETSVRAAGGRVVRRLPFALVVETDGPRKFAPPPEIAWIAPDVSLPLGWRAVPDDPLYGEQWSLHSMAASGSQSAIRAELAWEVTRGTSATGKSVRVAILDDGFDLSHPDLRFAPLGVDLSLGPCAAPTEPPCDGDAAAGPNDPHGTWSAGVLAGAGFNGIGMTGVCPECEVLPVRISGGGRWVDLFEANASTLAAAIVWATDNGADVISSGWGPPDGNPREPGGDQELWVMPEVVSAALRYASIEGRGGKGAVLVWSAGNGAELATYDRFASDPRVLAVGSVDATGKLAWYSDYGPTVDLVAPSSGGPSEPKIWTTDLTGSASLPGDYTSGFGGTSASGAMVSGVAALLVSAYPQLTAAQVHEALLLSATKLDQEGGDYKQGRSSRYGFGRVDAVEAIRRGALYPTGSSCTSGYELCGNARDDNCDGLLDEDDPSCAQCIPDLPAESCDGRDNDCDGEVDEDGCSMSELPPRCGCSGGTGAALSWLAVGWAFARRSPSRPRPPPRSRSNSPSEGQSSRSYARRLWSTRYTRTSRGVTL